MSVLIKGIEKPTSCAACRFCGEYCYAKGDENKRSKLPCPLIPVPEHGRLIEEKAIKNKIANHIFDTEYAWGWNAAMKQCYEAVEDAPTIIPAEEGE